MFLYFANVAKSLIAHPLDYITKENCTVEHVTPIVDELKIVLTGAIGELHALVGVDVNILLLTEGGVKVTVAILAKLVAEIIIVSSFFSIHTCNNNIDLPPLARLRRSWLRPWPCSGSFLHRSLLALRRCWVSNSLEIITNFTLIQSFAVALSAPSSALSSPSLATSSLASLLPLSLSSARSLLSSLTSTSPSASPFWASLSKRCRDRILPLSLSHTPLSSLLRITSSQSSHSFLVI